MINVDKPKFFINELAYQDSIGNLKSGIMTGWSDGTQGNHDGSLQEIPIPIYNHPEKPFLYSFENYANLSGAPPEARPHIVLSLKTGYWNDILLDENNENMTDSSSGCYYAILGQLRNSGFSINCRDETWEEMYDLDHYDLNHSVSVDNVYNNHGDGWFMVKNIKQGMVSNCRTLTFGFNAESIFGCLTLGNYTTLAHNPNMGYDFELMNDGINYKTAKGGTSYSYSNYNGPPNWYGGGAAWEVGYSSASEVGNPYVSSPSIQRRGRRAYGLSWEGFADTSVMPTNVLSTAYSNTDDLGTNTTILDGNTLYNQVLIKTLDNSFIFQQDSTSFEPQNFMIARWDKPDMSFSQISHKIYSFKNSIIESW